MAYSTDICRTINPVCELLRIRQDFSFRNLNLLSNLVCMPKQQTATSKCPAMLQVSKRNSLFHLEEEERSSSDPKSKVPYEKCTLSFLWVVRQE